MEVKEIPSFSEAQVRWIKISKRTQKKVGKQEGGGGWYRQRFHLKKRVHLKIVSLYLIITFIIKALLFPISK